MLTCWVERIRSDKTKERNEGLAGPSPLAMLSDTTTHQSLDLKYILKQNSRTPRLYVANKMFAFSTLMITCP